MISRPKDMEEHCLINDMKYPSSCEWAWFWTGNELGCPL